MELSRKFSKRYYFKCTLVYFLTCCMFFNTSLSVALAGPEGAQVVNGQVSFQQSGYNTTITASDRSIINYSSFDIARPEIVQFIQPGSSASVLNRILSANPTNINGTLLANGRVFFVNPAGVYIGAGARVNVNQLVASGLNITNSDFINGQYNFAGGNGSVINSGDISAEKVYLIGKQVANSGNISCPDGYVVMASGDRVFLGEPGTDVVLEMDTPSVPESAETIEGSGVLNEGTVDAAGGTIVLAAGDIYSQAISNTGSLSASVEAGEAGQIKLTADGGQVTNTGTIEASGSKGGQVAMEGARVGQFGTIHADGTDSDGGSVDLLAGEVVALSSDSLTTANAGTNGDGGDVTVFSPDTALFWPDAKIEAKGGSESGNGGFVEVSGKKHVEIYGLVDTTAPKGDTGTFLIDPTDITISTGSDTSTMNWHGLPLLQFYDEDILSGPSNLNVGTLQTQLASSNVEVTTTPSHTTNTDPGNIEVQDAISWSSANKLKMTADNDIIVKTGATITNTSTGDLEFDATGNVDIDADISLTSGVFTSGGFDFDNTGGDITAGGGIAINHTGTVTLGADLNPGGGTISGTSTSITVASSAAQIQDAINISKDSAAPSDNLTITVQPGLYQEDLVIPASKTNIELVGADRSTTTIQGQTMVASASWPLANPNIDILGDGTQIHDFTIRGPDPQAGYYASGIVIGGDNVEIYNNNIEVTNASTLNDISQGIQTYRDGNAGAGDLDELNIHNNDFSAHGTGTAGYEGIFINHVSSGTTPANRVTIHANTFSGQVVRAITTERSKTDITNNIINTTLPPVPSGGAFAAGNSLTGILVQDFGVSPSWVSRPLDSVNITGNTSSGFTQGLRVGQSTGSAYTNISATGNTFSNNTLQVQDRIGALNIANTLSNNTFDKAVTVDTGGGTLLGTIWSSIQDGIDNASDSAGHTVDIMAGTYAEDVTVDKSLTLSVPTSTATMTSLSSDSGKTTGLSGNFAANSFQFAGAVTLAGHASLSTGTGTGNIDFQSTLDGRTDFTENLTLTAGTGDISFGNDGTDVVGGTALGDVIIKSAQNVTADAAFTAKSLEQQAGTGKTWFKSTITTKGATATQGGNVDITTDGDIEIVGKVDATGGATASPGQNGGNVTLSGNNITVDEIDTSGTNASGPGDEAGGAGGNIQITSTTKTTLNDNLTAAGGSGFGAGSDGTGGNITLNGPTELAADVMISTGATAGNIDFSDIVNGSAVGNESLSLTAGTGAVTLQAVGTATALEELNITASGLTTLNGGIDTDDNAGTGNVDLSAATGGVTLGADVTIDTDDGDDGTGGAVDLSGSAVDGAFDLSIDTGDDTVTLAAVGTTTALGSLTIATTGGLTTLGGSIETDDHVGADTAAVDLSGAAGGIKISTDVVINTDDTGDSSGGLVDLSGSAVVSTTDAAEGLTIGAADGAVTLAGVGTTSALEYLSVTGGSASLGGSITTDNSVGTGDVTIATTGNTVLTSTVTIDTDDAALGADDSSGGSIDLSGTSILPTTVFTEQLILDAPGASISLGNAGSEALEMGALTFNSGFGTLNLGGAIYTDGGFNATNATTVVLTGDSVIETDNDGTAINFTGTPINGTTAGTESLTLSSGGGAVTLDSVGTGTALEAFSITTSGPTTLNGGIDTDDNAGTGNVDLSAATGGIKITTDVAINTDDAGDASGGLIHFGSALDGTTDFAENLTLTAGSGDIYFDGVVGGIKDLGDVTVNSADNVYIKAAFNANNIVITASDSTIDIDDNVTAAVDIELNNNTTVADGTKLEAGNDIKMGAGKTLTGEGNLTLIATTGGITEKASDDDKVHINMADNDKTLMLTQNDTIAMANFSVSNSSTTNLEATSTGGSVSVLAGDDNPADKWKSVIATAEDNIELSGNGDIKIGGDLTSYSGGVSIISDNGAVRTAGDTILDNVDISGYSDGTTGVDIPNPLVPDKGIAAIVIKSDDDLEIGPDCTFTANGEYDPSDDERTDAIFVKDGSEIDVAVYLRSVKGDIIMGSSVAPPIGPVIDIDVDSTGVGALIVDAYDTVTFNNSFEDYLQSPGSTIKRIEAVSRITQTLNTAQEQSKFPHGDNPDAVLGLWTNFGGFDPQIAYVLRGENGGGLDRAWVLSKIDPVPLVLPKPLEPEVQGEVEEPDMEAIARLLDELGIGVQPFLARAYRPSLNTDLSLFKAAEKLLRLGPILEDADGTRLAALVPLIRGISETPVPVEEQITSFVQELARQELAGQWINALVEYAAILNSDIGLPADASVARIMVRYGGKLTGPVESLFVEEYLAQSFAD